MVRRLLKLGTSQKGIVGSLLLIKSGEGGGDTLKRVASNTLYQTTISEAPLFPPPELKLWD
jgi:hypothetical protein